MVFFWESNFKVIFNDKNEFKISAINLWFGFSIQILNFCFDSNQGETDESIDFASIICHHPSLSHPSHFSLLIVPLRPLPPIRNLAIYIKP
jgi:carbohydrate-binding DOMON domain-containing protein